MRRRRASMLFSVILIILSSLVIVTVLFYEQISSSPLLRSSVGALCQHPLDHIFLLKTHKCGSSTVQNILMRRGFNRGLNFVLPEKANYLGHPELFDPWLHVGPLLQVPGGRYDVFAHHSRLHAANVRRVLAPDARRVTILREPAALFESLYDYYHLSTAFQGLQMENVLQMNLSELQQMFTSKGRFMNRIGINQMSFDLGVDAADFSHVNASLDLVQLVEGHFHLVMISEHMEASLVLLADLMCWPLEEVTFIKVNARPPDKRTLLARSDVEMLEELNRVDYELYNHFKDVFKSRIIKYGKQKMERDVIKLMHLNEKLYEECISKEFLKKQDLKRKNYPVIHYKLRDNAPSYCRLYVIDEINFTELLRNTQINKFKTINRLRKFVTT